MADVDQEAKHEKEKYQLIAKTYLAPGKRKQVVAKKSKSGFTNRHIYAEFIIKDKLYGKDEEKEREVVCFPKDDETKHDFVEDFSKKMVLIKKKFRTLVKKRKNEQERNENVSKVIDKFFKSSHLNINGEKKELQKLLADNKEPKALKE